MEGAHPVGITGKTAINGSGAPYAWLKSYPADVDWFQKFTPAP